MFMRVHVCHESACVWFDGPRAFANNCTTALQTLMPPITGPRNYILRRFQSVYSCKRYPPQPPLTRPLQITPRFSCPVCYVYQWLRHAIFQLAAPLTARHSTRFVIVVLCIARCWYCLWSCSRRFSGCPYLVGDDYCSSWLLLL